MITMTTPATAPVLPDLDRPDAAQIGDEILLSSAASAKVGRVSGKSSSIQSHEARAWTRSGNVD